MKRKDILVQLIMRDLTMSDVAKTAGVSLQFVSNVLAGREKMSRKLAAAFRKNRIDISDD